MSAQVSQCRVLIVLIPETTVFCGLIAFAVSAELIINEPHGPLTVGAALPSLLAMTAKVVCLAGIGMWFKCDAIGVIRRMGA